MKIVHINTYDISGGAARATYRLHRALRRLGHDSLMFTAKRRSDDSTVVAFARPKDLPSRLRRRLRREWIARSFARYKRSRPDGYELFSNDRSEHGHDMLDQIPPRDVINLHWIAGFVDYRLFFEKIPGQTPIVWTLQDMNAFTGGCHYDHDCGKFTDGCGACPQLGSSDKKDLSHRIWKHKRNIFEQIPPGRLHIVTPSRWLADEVKRSPLLSCRPVSVIPNSVDTGDFTPRDRRSAREVLGIPQDAKVVLFAAQSINNRFKGFDILAKAIDKITDPPDLFLFSIGEGKSTADLKTPHIHWGPIDNDRMISITYNAADLFVAPSLQENLCLTVLESMACGTPVIGFDVGGIPDMVRPGVTGLLSPSGDITALGSAISELLRDDTKRAEMSANCRRIVEREYSLEVIGRRYVELYESILVESDKMTL